MRDTGQLPRPSPPPLAGESWGIRATPSHHDHSTAQHSVDRTRVLVWVACLAMLAQSPAALAQARASARTQAAVAAGEAVIKISANLRVGPGAQHGIVAVLARGEIVQVLGTGHVVAGAQGQGPHPGRLGANRAIAVFATRHHR